MKLFSADQVREWDQYTIAHEPIASIDLMERAAGKCVDWLERNNFTHQTFHIFCGKGNNGGDGLAIARLLSTMNVQVTVHILEFGHKGTDDFQVNLARLHRHPEIVIRFIQSEEHFQALQEDEIVIDALFGSGLNRGIEGVTASLVQHINKSGCTIISIDIPSGLFTDRSSKGNTVIEADHTLAFQTYKLAYLVAENRDYIGEVHILDIGLHTDYYNSGTGRFELVDQSFAREIYKPRSRFGHKGEFGHALIIAGSYGKIGAAVLSARACLRSGVGLLTCHVPGCGYEILQTAVPEAMVSTDFNSSFVTGLEESLDPYDVIGIGPGIGKASETRSMLKNLQSMYKKPLVIDADALNIIASHKELLDIIPAGSILTPHPKEFERLFGETATEFDRIELALEMAKQYGLVIVLKGHHTFIATPGGAGYFNSTGNAGMATGGSGDVLTGILAALLAQSYTPVESAILGVYLHGFAGNMAAERLSMEAMTAGDIVDSLGEAFINVHGLFFK